MIRFVFVHFLLFALPFILYLGYVRMTRAQREPGNVWKGAPLFGLLLAGLALMAVGFISLSVFTGSDTGGTYHPAQLRDGKLIPGYIE